MQNRSESLASETVAVQEPILGTELSSYEAENRITRGHLRRFAARAYHVKYAQRLYVDRNIPLPCSHEEWLLGQRLDQNIPLPCSTTCKSCQQVPEVGDDDVGSVNTEHNYIFPEDFRGEYVPNPESGLRSDLERQQRSSGSNEQRPIFRPPPTTGKTPDKCEEHSLYMVGDDEPIKQKETRENVTISTINVGTAMLDTGCTKSIGGKVFHKEVQDNLDRLGKKYT